MKNFILIALFFQLLSCNKAAVDKASVDNAPTDNEASQTIEDGISSNEHRLFISSSSHGGNLGGRIGADNICQNLAITAGLTREYKALLSTSDNNVIENYTDKGRIYAFDSSNTKTLIATSLIEFISGNLVSDPRWDEVKNELLASDDPGYGLRVWTGYISDSAYAGIIRTCADWTSSSYDNGNSNAGFMGYPQNVECKNPADPHDFWAMMKNTKAECEDAGFTWTRNTGRYTFEISNGGSTCGDANRIYCISN